MSSSALDLSAHSSEITSTHQRILNKDPSIDWALYGFERGSSSVLAVHAQGGAGLEELSEEFDDGKVQFAFARVIDPNTQLPKFVFISWCGRGVPVFRKGMVASQVGEVQQVLTGYHVAVVARSEEDVQAKEIMDQVARSSGAQYSYHTQPKRQAPPAPAAKPAFAAGTAFRKGGSYGAPSVTKGSAWSAEAVSAATTAYNSAKPGPSAAVGGSKPLFGGSTSSGGGGGGGGRPVSSLFGGARSPTIASISPEPSRAFPQQPSPSSKTQQDETRAELEALRRGSRAQSPSTPVAAAAAAAAAPTALRVGASTPGEPSARVTQADQTKNELEMLRSRKHFNGASASSPSSGAASSGASERKAELDALRRSRAGSQSSSSLRASQPTPPVRPWNQQDDGEEERRRQQDEEERRRQQQLRDEEKRRRQQQQQQDEEERRRQQQQQQQMQEESAKRQAPVETAAPADEAGQLARAVYDYEATAEDELEFNEGDIIYR
ncbi:actin binding protein, partial [Coemansia sp. RSA 2399]